MSWLAALCFTTIQYAPTTNPPHLQEGREMVKLVSERQFSKTLADELCSRTYTQQIYLMVLVYGDKKVKMRQYLRQPKILHAP